MTDNEEKLVPVSRIWGDIFALVSSRLLIAGCILFALTFGCFVGVRGLADPDTCWLLRLGEYVFQHHCLPATDPYSFTFALQNHSPFVMYQWLSELLFFCAYKIDAEISLLVFSAVLLAVAFWIMPLRCQSPQMSKSILLPLAMLGSVASCFHFLVRPEIFSYVCLASCFCLLHQALNGSAAAPGSLVQPESAAGRTAADSANSNLASLDWRLVAAMAGLFVVWANLHTGFVIGLVVGLIALLGSLFQPRRNISTLSAALLCSTFATLINPNGLGLWRYLPGLFFAPFNFLIQELRPLGAADLHEFTYYPYLAFVSFMAFALGRSIIGRYRKEGGTRAGSDPCEAGASGAYWFAVLSTFVFLVAGFVCRRLIPFAVLIALMNVSVFWIQSHKSTKATDFSQLLEARLAQIVDIRGVPWLLTVLAFIICGCIFGATKVVKAQIPQSLVLPSRSLAFFENKLPAGHLFNDAQYGDIIIWKRLPVQVFIDTRYDMYGPVLIADYLSINRCEPGWEQLLDKYEISCIFIPKAGLSLSEKLSANKQWQPIYADSVCCIFKRGKR